MKKLLKELGVWHYMPVQNGMGVVGIPDFICCWNGVFLAIETKAPGKKHTLTANQERHQANINAAGGYAFVVDSVDELKEKLSGIGQVVGSNGQVADFGEPARQSVRA